MRLADKPKYAPFIVVMQNGKKHYKRWTFSDGTPAHPLSKKYAVQFYQSLLLSSAMGYYSMQIELRRVKEV